MEEKTTARSAKILLITLIVLGAAQMLIGRNLSNLAMFNPANYHYDRTSPLYSISQRQQNPQEYEEDAPTWSSFARQHHKNTTELDSSLRWKIPRRKNARRNVIEALTYGISGAFPWFSRILPAVRFDLPFTNTSKLEIVIVEGIADATFDFNQCMFGRKYENLTEPDGYYDVCFTADIKSYKETCRMKRERRHDYPAPGHERWSCQDTHVMEQLVGAQIIDYIIGHYDRFGESKTHNLFFLAEERPIKLISIDHDHHTYFKKFFKNGGHNKYDEFVVQKYLLQHDMPQQLRDEIRDVVLLGSKDDFVKGMNATLQGQLDNLNMVVANIYNRRYSPKKWKEKPFVADVIWNRLQNVVDYYNITVDK